MTMMDELYGDGSNHKACDSCGLCKTCGDCICGHELEDGHSCDGFPGGCERMGCHGGESCMSKGPNADFGVTLCKPV